MKILFLCVANSARSQIAEGLVKALMSDLMEVESAGSEPSGIVNPLAIETMQEIGIDLSKHRSKFYNQLSPSFLAGLDYVISLCAEEVCPTMVHARAAKLKWPFPDPASAEGSYEERLAAFRDVREQIRKRLLEFRNEAINSVE
jgi:arsenate reductase